MATKSNTGKIAAGMGVAAIAAAAAAAYYFKGPKGKEHSKQFASMAKKAKTEMVSKMKQMKTVSKKAYDQATKEVLAKYKDLKNVDPSEIVALGSELKGHWDDISKSLKDASMKTMKATVKKALPKKTSKKK